MRGVRVDDTYEVPHEFTQVPTQRNDQGVVTGCQSQYAPDGIVAIPLEESAGSYPLARKWICCRVEVREIAAMSSIGLRAGVFSESYSEEAWDRRWERAGM
jgi:hypothetical protein